MPKAKRVTRTRGVTGAVRARVEKGGERYWRYVDFDKLPAQAVAQALHRLENEGVVRKVRKGIYYRGRQTAFGPSVPSDSDIAAVALRTPLQPAGLTAANILGLTTQNPARGEYATTSQNAPGVVQDAIVHTRRPASRGSLSSTEGALLEFLRERGRSSELSPKKTAHRLLTLLRENQTYERVARAAMHEPPRVRAMLGALGEELGASGPTLARLRRSLNALSRYDFGILNQLRYADRWQAR